MWIAVAAIVAMVLGFVAVANGFIPPPGARTLIRIRNGEPSVQKGSLLPFAREHLSEILSDGGVREGFIAISGSRRVAFSRQIPSTLHQRIRNVLLNQ